MASLCGLLAVHAGNVLEMLCEEEALSLSPSLLSFAAPSPRLLGSSGVTLCDTSMGPVAVLFFAKCMEQR